MEKPSPELDEVYRSKGVQNMDHAPDETSSEGMHLGAVSQTLQSVDNSAPDGAKELPEQAKGKGPAPDGTSTPSSMIYRPQSSSSSSDQTKSTRRTTPPMLIGLGQVTLISKAFNLKPNETMDVNRAIEQAQARAETAQPAGQEEGAGVKPEQLGTTWRGNLHR